MTAAMLTLKHHRFQQPIYFRRRLIVKPLSNPPLRCHLLKTP